MKRTFEIVFRDVYGGDGKKRAMPTEVHKLLRTRSSVRTRTDLGIPIESTFQEVVSEKSEEQVETFEFVDGCPVLRLGGIHGKF